MPRVSHPDRPVSRPSAARGGLGRFLPELLIVCGATALAFGLRIVAFLH